MSGASSSAAAIPCERQLEERWEQLCKQIGADDAAPACSTRWWACIRDHYCEPSRRYHILKHLQFMFGYFDQYQTKLERPQLVSLAIFFHDIIYDGSPQNDEEASAAEFRKFGAESQLPQEDIDIVADWIIRTADHKCSRKDSTDCRFFMDFDLSILGQPWDTYKGYFCAVSEEYRLLKRVSPLIWRAIFPFFRSTAMAPLLNVDRGPIFSTTEFQQAMEAQAQANLSRELIHWIYLSTMMIVAVVAVLCIPIGLALAYPDEPLPQTN
jgi:predicted metal-dependent HD superfamily phosphohydrolase